MKVLGALDNAKITKELKVVVRKIKARKVAGLDGCAVKCLKSGSTSVIKWLVRLLNVCFVTSLVPINWTCACVVPLYKVKG